MPSKENLTCKQIASYLKNEYDATKTYGELGKKLNIPQQSGNFSEMSGDENNHFFKLMAMAQSSALKCDQKPWWNKEITKIAQKEQIMKK